MPELHELVRRAYPFAELSRELLDNVLDMLDGRYPSEEFAELRPRIVWDRVAGHDPARARGARSWPSPTRARSPTAACTACTCPTAGAWASSTRRWSTRRAPGQTFLLGASTWRIEEITRDRVIVTPAPGAPGAVPFWKGDGVGPAGGAGPRDRRVLALGGRPRARRSSRADVRPRRARGAQPRRLPARAARGDARRADRPHDRDRALPRRDRRLARCACCRRSAAACTPPGRWRSSARIRDERGLESDAIWSDDGIIVHLPDADEPPGAELVLIEPGRARGAGRARAVRLGAVRRALPRERRPRAAAPARLPGQAHAAVAAAAEGAVAARGGEALRPVPDRARDLPRVPARRARPARRSRSCCAGCTRASCRWSRSRPSARRRSRPRCCSTTSPPTCTRATRRTPSGARRRCRSTATCCASCSARRSCAS